MVTRFPLALAVPIIFGCVDLIGGDIEVPEAILSEWLFYGGILIMAIAAILAVIAAIVLAVSRKRLQERMDAEYGKRRR